MGIKYINVDLGFLLVNKFFALKSMNFIISNPINMPHPNASLILIQSTLFLIA